MDFLFIILSILFEGLFFYIAIKAMKKDKISIIRNILLYLGIIFSNLISGIILSASIFRYLLFATLFFGLLKLIYKSRFYDFLILNLVFLFKGTVELILFVIFINSIDEITYLYNFLFSGFIMIFPILLNKIISIFYIKLTKLWDNIYSFYVRYILCFLTTLAMLFYFYRTVQFMRGAM